MTDYLKFWGLTKPLFISPVDSKDMVLSERLASEYEQIRQLCQSTIGLMTIIGPSGSGKTLLCRWLYETIPVKTVDILFGVVAMPETRAGWFMPQLSKFLGVTSQSLADITERLFDLREENRKLVILVDAAHLLRTAEAFTEIITLLAIAEISGKHLTFVLSGREQLHEMIASIPELNTRLGFEATLKPWNTDESLQYLQTRALQAKIDFNFDRERVEALTIQAHGNPAILNQEAEKLLIAAANLKSKTLPKKDLVTPPIKNEVPVNKEVEVIANKQKVVKLSSLFQKNDPTDNS